MLDIDTRARWAAEWHMTRAVTRAQSTHEGTGTFRREIDQVAAQAAVDLFAGLAYIQPVQRDTDISALLNDEAFARTSGWGNR